MPENINTYAINGIEEMFYAVRIAGVPQGTSGSALTNGSSAGMGKIKGITALDLSEPDAPKLPILGNNGVIGQFMGQPQELPSGSYTMTVFDQVFHSRAIGTGIHVSGGFDMVAGFPACFQFADMCFVVNSPAKSFEAGSIGVSGWAVYEMFLLNVQSKLFTAFATNAVKEFGGTINANLSDVMLTGELVSDTDLLTNACAGVSYWSDAPVTFKTMKGNGTADTLVLDETPFANNANGIQIFVDGVELLFSDFTLNVSTKTITFDAAPGAGDLVVVRYKYVSSC
jgi:hypothetical protein